MVIVTAADDAFAMPMAVTLYSALANLKGVRAVSLYIIDGGISERNRLKLAQVLNVKHLEVQIEWGKPDFVQLDRLIPCEWNTQAAYLRLLIPELLPTRYDRAIYLDSDLVVERDLEQLWEQDIEAYPALAVLNFIPPFIGCKREQDKNFPLFGLPPDTPYCNTGVMVMNLKRWRQEKIGSRALEFARKFPLPEGDQDALNIIIAGEWGLIDPKWNVQLSGIDDYGRFYDLSELEMQQKREELLREPYVLHFTWRIKPWHLDYTGPARLRFFHYLKHSGWFGNINDINDLIELAWEEQDKYDHWVKQWERQLHVAQQDLYAIVPPGDSLILVDGCTWPSAVVEGWHTIPFLERDGVYWGNPPEDDTAIRELERLRGSGATFIVFAWPAFWWLDYYAEFSRYLYSKFRCVLRNDRLIVFDLLP